ncbi:MAG TPA: pilus assembly protein TadG-related protein [Intrasporangium sp.]|nr:pilus assembly protein TadG-related protein [Intrasporangium sp.]
MRGESGQTSVLIVGFAFVLLLMVGVVVDASAAYLQREGLNNLADGAALAGADEVRGEPVYSGGLDEQVPIDRRVARQAVGAYFRGIGAYDDYPGLRFTIGIDEDEVVVRVNAPLDLPITVGGITDARVAAEAAAVVNVSE